jgi:SAM-dependent methyltransferase
MHEVRATVLAHYSGAVARHGATPRGVDWQCTASQYLRFVQLLKVCDFDGPFSLNDFGCGYGALLAFLADRFPGASIDYHGVDMSPPMIEAAHSLWRGAPRTTFTLASECRSLADYSLASGVFNVRLSVPIGTWERYVESILRDLRANSRRGFAVNFMGLTEDGSNEEEGLYRTPPKRWLDFCAAQLGCMVELVSGYGLREFTLLARIPH